MKILELFSLSNRVALVTGGRRGIGKTIVMAMAEAGADIAICDYTNENGEFEKLTAKLKKIGRNCLTIKADVSKSEQVSVMVRKVMEEYGKIDILVNNAGISPGTPAIPELKESDWDTVIDTNLKGCYLCTQAVCQAVSQTMTAQSRGSIINIASVEGLSTVRKASSPYGVSKAGIIMLTRGLAWDLGKFNIRVNAIAPGFIKTDMTRSLWDTNSPEFKQTQANYGAQFGINLATDNLSMLQQMLINRMIPMARYAQPEEIAAGALYLASDASSYVTGHTLVIDGGMLA